MVALCFSMRREIGENHEMAARTQLKIIESQAWGELRQTRPRWFVSAVGHLAVSDAELFSEQSSLLN